VLLSFSKHKHKTVLDISVKFVVVNRDLVFSQAKIKHTINELRLVEGQLVEKAIT
jgi:hypothetical protein